ncbi:MAG: endonuclease/exonuclease/phosphatase family protein [Planctomycetota bacterium]|nr:MAG: endonuclease/exonuclease/phosphatase family protein [Planctomycetota bacterium]
MTADSTHRARWPSRVLWLALAGLAGLTALAATAPWWWLGEVACSFRWQLGWACAALALALTCVARLSHGVARLSHDAAPQVRRWLAAALALLALYHLAPQLALWWPTAHEPRAGREFTVASANLFIASTDTSGFVEWVRATQPDVLGVTEVNSTWRAVCEQLADLYPVRLYHPQDAGIVTAGTYGTGLLSRLPLSSSTVHEHGNLGGFVEAELVLDGAPLHVVMLHPNRPGRGGKWERREALLERVLGDVVYREHSVLMGDFNTTSYSPRFGAILERTRLSDSRAGFGRQPTFDTKRIVPGLSVDIDHVLVGASIDVLERRAVAVRGSDHRYVEARLSLATR